MNEKLRQHYGFLFEQELLEEIERTGTYASVSKGKVIIDIEQAITHIPLLLAGAIKVLREDDEGDELLLYFLERGDTCAMTFSCCLGSSKSEIRAVTESDTELLMIPVAQMDLWMGRYRSWQNFILESYHTRMMELLETVDTLAFMKMDERLLKHLQDKAKVTHDDMIQTTHHEVALDLHTSRVVVSRVLKRLENDGKIKLHRNRIQVLDI